MKTGIKRLIGVMCALMLFGPALVNAKCKCGKPPKDKVQVKNHLTLGI